VSRAVPSAVDLDFSGRRRPPGALGWLMLACGALAALGVLHEFDVAETRVAEARHAYERARRQTAVARPARPPAAPLTDPERRAAIGVAVGLGRDWNALLAALETAADDPGLALLELDQDGAKGRLKLSGEARNLPEVFAFVKRLEAIPALRDVRLAGYAFRQDGPIQVVGFELQARWEAQP
jgi:hypothetical protein